MSVYFRGRKSDPPIRVWRERVDDQMVIVVAFSEAFSHGRYYAWSVFVLVPMQDYLRNVRHELQAFGENLFRVRIQREHYGTLPYIGPALAVESI